MKSNTNVTNKALLAGAFAGNTVVRSVLLGLSALSVSACLLLDTVI